MGVRQEDYLIFVQQKFPSAINSSNHGGDQIFKKRRQDFATGIEDDGAGLWHLLVFQLGTDVLRSLEAADFLPEDYILSVALRPALSEYFTLLRFPFDVSLCQRFVTLVLTLAPMFSEPTKPRCWCVCGGFYLLTYSMEQIPSWEAYSFQLVKKFPAFYGIRRFLMAFTSIRHLSLSWASSIQPIPPTSHFLKIQLNIIPLSTPGSPKWSLTFRFPHQSPVYASHLPHTSYIPRPAHSSRFYHPNNIGWGVQIINTLRTGLSNSLNARSRGLTFRHRASCI